LLFCHNTDHGLISKFTNYYNFGKQLLIKTYEKPEINFRE
jgi:hypothetical protein